MFAGQFVFCQLLEYLPRRAFQDCVRRYHGDQRLRGFSCRDQFLTLAFAQLTYRESLRDIETCLRALGPKLYHAGFRGRVSRNTLADANRVHDWRIYADFAQILIRQARQLYADEPFGATLNQTAYALDSTTIDLCLSLFPWAEFRRRKAAITLHTLLDLHGHIPCFVHISAGKLHDVKILDTLPIEPGAYYVMDRGYLDLARLYRFTTAGAFFVIRSKRNRDYRRTQQRAVDKATGLRSDLSIRFNSPRSVARYPDRLRRIAFHDTEHDRRLVFLTNPFLLPAWTVAQMYRSRWQVELFFKWIKQNLRIKAFYGTTENAVKTQIWIVISVYVLIAIVRKQTKTERSMSDILQILSLTLFEKMPLFQAFSDENSRNRETPGHNQPSLFDL
ncbi:IS4 family transposase [Fimbriiglobus ruber]|uniref:Transposase IS4 family protein n=1 Tax=Fimbriiglobus ruber TaxID=1908690 RepID=A0A225DEU9_9BACT|nr:IS4 family transposase [Fimbriiglobus ruber]OWK35679.1 transposase IS4 family protein [Fimbriiglobus ruber]